MSDGGSERGETGREDDASRAQPARGGDVSAPCYEVSAPTGAGVVIRACVWGVVTAGRLERVDSVTVHMTYRTVTGVEKTTGCFGRAELPLACELLRRCSRWIEDSERADTPPP